MDGDTSLCTMYEGVEVPLVDVMRQTLSGPGHRGRNSSSPAPRVLLDAEPDPFRFHSAYHRPDSISRNPSKCARGDQDAVES